MVHRLGSLLVVTGIFLGTACDQVLSVDLPPEEDFLTAYAFLQAGDTASTVIVDRTYGYFESTDPAIANLDGPAEVSLWRSGNPAGTWQQRDQSSYYDGRHEPLTDTTADYRFRVSHPGFEAMEARGAVPRRAGAFAAELLEDLALPDGRVINRAIAITFSDPEPAGDYYGMGIQFPFGNAQDTAWFPQRVAPVLLTAAGSELALEAFFEYNAESSWFINDANLAGKTIRVVFELRQVIGDNPLYIVYLQNLNRDQFAFIRFLANENLGLPESFTQYPNVFSNFDNGVGLFAIYWEQRTEVTD